MLCISEHIVLLLGVQEKFCFWTLAVYMSMSLEMKIGLCV